jgi:CubicO group peptidase (beta-lactamase class C family)
VRRIEQRLVTMHARGADGSLKPIEFEMPQEPEFFMGGGGLYSTGLDYLKFVRMFLNRGILDGKTLLRPETVAMMGQNQIGDVNVVVLKSVLPDSSLDAEFFPGMVKKWGLGFMINTETAPTGRSAGSLAWAGLANTYFWIDPSKNIAGVILMQLLPFADPQALQTFAEFESRLTSLPRSRRWSAPTRTRDLKSPGPDVETAELKPDCAFSRALVSVATMDRFGSNCDLALTSATGPGSDVNRW